MDKNNIISVEDSVKYIRVAIKRSEIGRMVKELDEKRIEHFVNAFISSSYYEHHADIDDDVVDCITYIGRDMY